jgi:predicted nucleic acid-binding protein
MGKVGEWEEIFGKVFDNFFFAAAMEFCEDVFDGGFFEAMKSEGEKEKDGADVRKIGSGKEESFSEKSEADFAAMLFAPSVYGDLKQSFDEESGVFESEADFGEELLEYALDSFFTEERKAKGLKFEDFEKSAENLNLRALEGEENFGFSEAYTIDDLKRYLNAEDECFEAERYGEYALYSELLEKIIGNDESESLAVEKNYDEIFSDERSVGGRSLAKKILESEARIKGGVGGDVKIEMVNNNNISSDTDIDDIADMLTMRIFEIMQKSADGLY